MQSMTCRLCSFLMSELAQYFRTVQMPLRCPLDRKAGCFTTIWVSWLSIAMAQFFALKQLILMAILGEEFGNAYLALPTGEFVRYP